VKIGHRHADVALPPDFLLRCVVRVVQGRRSYARGAVSGK
jgi:hypothetical protein